MNFRVNDPQSLQAMLEFDEIIEIPSSQIDFYIRCYSSMYLIREVEKVLAENRKSGIIRGPVHLAAGQEAIPVGISTYLRTSDNVFSAHRSHAHVLSLDSNPRKLFAEVLGKSTGFSRGFGGSMHLFSGSNGFKGSVPIVSGTVPLAVGAGLASKMKRRGDIAVAYFGDGAMEEGVVHESLNAATLLKVPVLFICENNFFSSHLHIGERQPSWINARFAHANLIKTEIVDGNNIQRVLEAAEKLIHFVRETNMPAFLEAFTYRHFGHVDWREDIDVGVGRSTEDLKMWKGRDPILRLKSALLNHVGVKHVIQSIEESTIERIKDAWSLAESDSPIDKQQLMSHVYFDGSNRAGG